MTFGKTTAKKHLGQHFLVNQGVIGRIGEQVENLASRDPGEFPVIEIGPGQGALTSELLRRGLRVKAIEVDRDMVELLKEKFSEAIVAGRLQVIQKDALKIPPAEWKSSRVLCGNLPYNVGSAIVTLALKEWKDIRHFCFMLQKEVVEKFLATGGSDYGPASVRMRWSVDVGGHFWVKPGSFSPPPKVDSGVFWASRLAVDAVPDRLEERMQIIDRLFRQRRKMIRGGEALLKNSPWAEKRPEEISAADFLRLTDQVLAGRAP